MNNDETSRWPNIVKDIREEFIGEYSRLLQFSLLVFVVAFVGLASFRPTVGGAGEVALIPLATPLQAGLGMMATLIFLSGTQAIINAFIYVRNCSNWSLSDTTLAPLLISMLKRKCVQTVRRIMSVILAAAAAQIMYSAPHDWGIVKA